LITSKKLNKLNGISHGFFNRYGGKSKGIYKSLNCGPGSNDKRINIYENLKIVKSKINKDCKNIILLNQIHSNKFIYINKNYMKKRKFKADAIITNQKKLPIGVLTADCVPILICDKKKNIIAAIHAGWKGAYKNILTRVVKFMLKKNCHIKDMHVAIGPCISQKNYNVKEDFFKKFIKKDKKNSKFFKKRKNLLYFDLPGYIISQLKIMKISNIDHINIDTFEYKNNYFSARRSIRLKHDDYGRNISIIMIN
tara:strand:- start:956 stop:1714 length:759 start_codon:yes stop_codon:yes gene_type:complete